METTRAVVRTEGQTWAAVQKAGLCGDHQLAFGQISAFAAAGHLVNGGGEMNAGAFDNTTTTTTTTAKPKDGQDVTLHNGGAHKTAEGEVNHEQRELPSHEEADIRVRKWPVTAVRKRPAPPVAEWYASDEEDDVAEILEKIQPYIKMADAAYKETNMSGCIKMVARSRLLRGYVTDTEVHVCILKDNSVVFAFRGTETADLGSLFRDFVTDIKVAQEVVQLYNGPGGPVYTSPLDIQAHCGFQAALKDVTDGTDNLVHVLQELGMDAGDVGRVVCVGHSLGGALATLCAKWCREVAFPRAEIGCVTIGSPRVGNKAFAADFDRRVVNPGMNMNYRVVNKKDVVPCVPGLVCPNYKHVSQPIYLWEDEAGHMRSRLGGCRPSPPDLWSVILGDSFQDHGTDSYMASVCAALAFNKN